VGRRQEGELIAVATDAGALASFLPDRLVRRLVEDPQGAGQAQADRTVGALLLADISGFTAITERLARGPDGAERLRGLLDGAFQPLLELICGTGGDVLKFAGDALLACWPAAGPDQGRGLAAAAATAAGCAEAMQAALGRFAAAQRLPLALRIGVGAGEVVVLDIGGERERRELLVAGAAVPETTGAAERAPTGHPGPAQPPVAPAGAGAPAALVAPYVPRAMLASMVAGHEEWSAELRQITVVFANLPDLDHRIGLEEAQEVMVALQGALYRYEGSINKLTVDEKGTALVAALGLPPLAHEDDPARGVQAALAMREALAALGRRVAIGVTTGRAFCGTVGGPRRREYTMLGAVVNLAARLMQEVGDGVLCDQATATAARAALAFEALAPVRVKGRADPVAVYRPGRPATGPGRGRGPEPLSRVPLVGRDEERARLAGALGRLLGDGAGQTGGVQVLVLEGEAGAGKSRLVAELVDQAVAAGVPVLAGAGDAVERNTPWHAWQELFGQLPAFDVDDQEARRRVVLDLLGPDPELRDLTPLLNPVLALELPETARSAELSGQGRANRTRDLLVRLLRAVVGDRPVVVVIEDAHWLDSASTGLVLALSRERMPLLLVVATRSRGEVRTVADELGWGAYQRLLRAPNLERLVLDRLPPEAVEALVGQRLGAASVPRILADLVEEKSDGNPLFTEELTFALRDAGLVRVVDGHVQLASDVPDVLARRLPHTVHGAVTNRIDRLSPTQQLTVKVASVIGRVFAVVILRDVHPLRSAVAATLARDLAEIERADLTVLDTPEPDLSYLFKHVIIQESAYNLMLLSQRRQLHRSVAEWYERSGGGDLAQLAHHWRLAEVPDKAIHYLERAGADALREGAYAEALRFFTALLELDDDAPGPPAAIGRRPGTPDARSIRRARWEHQLGDAYLGLGQLALEQEHLHVALALLGRRTPASGRQLPGKLAWQTGQQLRNRVWPRPPVARSEATRAALEEAAEVYERLFLVEYHASKRARAVHQAVKGLNLAEAAGARSVEARLAAACSVAAGLLARHRLAEAYLRRAFAAVDGTDDASARSWVLQAAALYGIGVGRWAEVGRHLAEAEAIVRRLGDPRRLAEITGLQIWERYFQGELAGLPPILAELDRVGRQSGDAQVRSWAEAGHAVAGLRTGDLEEAAAALRRRPAPAPEAMLALQLGDRAAATEALRRALQRASRPPVKCYWFDLYAMTAEVALALWLDSRARGEGDTGPWRAMAAEAVDCLARYARVFPIGQPRARLHRGLLAWTSGRAAAARRDWRAALAAAERLGMRYDQALALDALGRHGDLGERPAHRERALALFEQLGVEDLTSPEALARRLATRGP
jgi:class 3 adenylate cyclase/tetratricopeptide (TPR) repeat protein